MLENTQRLFVEQSPTKKIPNIYILMGVGWERLSILLHILQTVTEDILNWNFH